MMNKVDDWNEDRFVIDLVASYKEGTSMVFKKNDLLDEITRIMECNREDAEQFFQKLIKKGLDSCSLRSTFPLDGMSYDIMEFGIIRGHLNPKDIKKVDGDET